MFMFATITLLNIKSYYAPILAIRKRNDIDKRNAKKSQLSYFFRVNMPKNMLRLPYFFRAIDYAGKYIGIFLVGANLLRKLIALALSSSSLPAHVRSRLIPRRFPASGYLSRLRLITASSATHGNIAAVALLSVYTMSSAILVLAPLPRRPRSFGRTKKSAERQYGPDYMNQRATVAAYRHR